MYVPSFSTAFVEHLLTLATVKSRKEKLQAMCEAQVASLRSRLDRRVNRIPASKRSMKLIDLLDAALPAAKPVRAVPAKKQVVPAPVAAPAPAIASAPAPTPVPTRPTAPTAATRKTRTAPAPAAKKEAPKPASKPAPKTTRGKKRPSDDGDKENEELNVPKKRAKTVAPAKPAATRSTRAASRKAVPSQVLSPKPDNSRPTVARTRRAR
jgi:outer membrane biosynthesis protein TonB